MALVTARNTVSGQVASIPEAFLTHPVFSKSYVAVEDDAKPYIPEMYKPKTASEAKPKKPVEDIKDED